MSSAYTRHRPARAGLIPPLMLSTAAGQEREQGSRTHSTCSACQDATNQCYPLSKTLCCLTLGMCTRTHHANHINTQPTLLLLTCEQDDNHPQQVQPECQPACSSALAHKGGRIELHQRITGVGEVHLTPVGADSGNTCSADRSRKGTTRVSNEINTYTACCTSSK